MAVPNTKGKKCNHILEMEIGDYLPMQVNDLTADYYIKKEEWGVSGNKVWKQEIDQINNRLNYANGIFYFIKVDDGLLVADRIILTYTTAYRLGVNPHSYLDIGNSTEVNIGGIIGRMRSLDGGIGYMDTNGQLDSKLPTIGNGAYPSDNEYDKYIVRSNLSGKISANDDTVWNHLTLSTITNQMLYTAYTTAIIRGGNGTGDFIGTQGYDNVDVSKIGFRPVFDYRHTLEG